MDEFALIERYFAAPARAMAGATVVQGIGDDCALLQPAAGMQLAISCDSLIEGRHFVPSADAARLGHKALAVNLSDLAACGATPLGFTLGLNLPAVDAPWLHAFSQGLLALANASGCPLVGGDTTRGPLAIHITVFGQVPQGQALLRSGARPGDDVYVSGALGLARAGLHVLQQHLHVGDGALRQQWLDRLDKPTPRLVLGQSLRGIASAAMDLSDGLWGDIGHLLRASAAGAILEAPALLAAAAPLWQAPELAAWSLPQQLDFILAGGDDYELLFTAAPTHRPQVLKLAQAAGVPVHRIGHITSSSGLRVHDAHGKPLAVAAHSFNHFASPSTTPRPAATAAGSKP